MDASLTNAIRERYEAVCEQIARAAARTGREAGAVRVLTVSKSQPIEVIQAAVGAGIRLFGENYVEEAVEKIHMMKGAEIEWHMIGHVQSRKAEEVAENFSRLHALDSLKLATRLERFCSEKGRNLPVLLEFNVSGEESKFGFPAWDESGWDRLANAIAPITELPHLQIGGLMTMPPYFDDPERTRPYFQILRKLQAFLGGRLPQADWTELSMGTSVDHIAAVEEGATLVRVGTAILGPRPVH
jgi:hypothetical protein